MIGTGPGSTYDLRVARRREVTRLLVPAGDRRLASLSAQIGAELPQFRKHIPDLSVVVVALFHTSGLPSAAVPRDKRPKRQRATKLHASDRDHRDPEDLMGEGLNPKAAASRARCRA